MASSAPNPSLPRPRRLVRLDSNFPPLCGTCAASEKPPDHVGRFFYRRSLSTRACAACICLRCARSRAQHLQHLLAHPAMCGRTRVSPVEENLEYVARNVKRRGVKLERQRVRQLKRGPSRQRNQKLGVRDNKWRSHHAWEPDRNVAREPGIEQRGIDNALLARPGRHDDMPFRKILRERQLLFDPLMSLPNRDHVIVREAIE